MSRNLITPTTNLRRPATDDEKAFWHISEESWSELVAKTGDSASKKNALNTLRKFDAAGRMMETDEGELAVEPCSWCTRPGLAVECRVYKGRKEKACAYCRRHGKSGCAAGDPSRAAAPSVEDRLASIEAQLSGLAVSNSALEASVAAILKRVDELEEFETFARSSIALLEAEPVVPKRKYK